MTVKGHLRVCAVFACVCVCVYRIYSDPYGPLREYKIQICAETVSGPESLQMLTANYYQKEIKMVERAREKEIVDRERAIHTMEGILYICE